MDPIVGKVRDVKAIWQEMQKYIRKDPPTILNAYFGLYYIPNN